MAAAILRPQLPEAMKLLVGYPPVPGNPPTTADVAAGIRLARDVMLIRRQYRPSLGA